MELNVHVLVVLGVLRAAAHEAVDAGVELGPRVEHGDALALDIQLIQRLKVSETRGKG